MTVHRPRRLAGAVPAQRIVTPSLVRDALQCIPAEVDRETWVRLAMSVKSELGDEGFDPWNDWSQQADGYSLADARDTWRSIKAGGRVKIGTLFGIAKQHGFRFPDAGAVQSSGQPDPEAVAEHQRQLERKRQQREADDAEYRDRADKAAHAACELWAQASEHGESAYLRRKGVQGYGVRYLTDGALLIPMRRASDGDAGDLQNVQRIAPMKPTAEMEARGFREKRFLPGGRKSGMLHWLGTPEGAALLCLAEGYATAASIHQATGLPVAVCFDAGNLVNVAKILRPLFPGTCLLVCGDNDQATQARTGKNPGAEKARSAARAANTAAAPAAAVLPAGLPAELSDFNDLAATTGLDEVWRQLDAAATDLLARPRQQAESAAGAAIDTADEGKYPAAAQEAHSAAPTDAGGDVDPADPFSLSEAGVFFTARDAEGNAKRPEWLCAPLRVTARTRNEGAEAWGYLLEFADPDGNAKTWAMPAQMLAGEGSEWAGYLRAMGLQMASGTRIRNTLARYIDTRRVRARAVCTDRIGWHGGVFVLPSGSVGTSETERYVFQGDGGIDDQYKRRGELVDWQRTVAAVAAGNSRLVFALCCAFAGPMLSLAGIESGGFHFRGDSSAGKTTALKVAASVYGPPGYMQRWRTTDNALEATAVQHCDSLLILDEFGQLDPKVAGECAYMLANEQEKGRATRGGLARRRRTWRLLFLSSGELGLAEHMRQAGKEVRAGQEVRFVDVPLDAGAGMGGLETMHAFDSAQALAEAIVRRAGQHYGTAGRAWLEWLAEQHAELPERLAALIERQKASGMPDAASQQVRRVANRFAVVAVAGELATKAGITGWQPGEAAGAVRLCFDAWLGARGHTHNSEEVAAVRQVAGWLEKNGDALFTWSHRGTDDHRGNTPLRAGFKRMVDDDGKPLKFDAATDYAEKRTSAESSERMNALVEHIILPEAFRREVCKGLDAGFVATVLRKRGHLVHEKDRLMNKMRLPGMGKVPCYHVRPTIFSDEWL